MTYRAVPHPTNSGQFLIQAPDGMPVQGEPVYQRRITAERRATELNEQRFQRNLTTEMGTDGNANRQVRPGPRGDEALVAPGSRRAPRPPYPPPGHTAAPADRGAPVQPGPPTAPALPAPDPETPRPAVTPPGGMLSTSARLRIERIPVRNLIADPVRTNVWDVSELATQLDQHPDFEHHPLHVKPARGGLFRVVDGRERWLALHMSGRYEVNCLVEEDPWA